MRRIKMAFVLLCSVLISQSVMAQLNSVHISQSGDMACFGVMIDGYGEVIVDAYGDVVRVANHHGHRSINSRYEYYNSIYDYEAGKIKSIGSLKFTYYSNFHDYEAGKIKSIGNIKFTYYSDFHDYEAGKIKSIGNSKVAYYSYFHDYEGGKLKSVGGVDVRYYSDFHDYEAGKLKSIGRYNYEYFSHGNGGRPKSGYDNVKVNGINFVVIDSKRRQTISYKK